MNTTPDHLCGLQRNISLDAGIKSVKKNIWDEIICLKPYTLKQTAVISGNNLKQDVFGTEDWPLQQQLTPLRV